MYLQRQGYNSRHSCLPPLLALMLVSGISCLWSAKCPNISRSILRRTTRNLKPYPLCRLSVSQEVQAQSLFTITSMYSPSQMSHQSLFLLYSPYRNDVTIGSVVLVSLSRHSSHPLIIIWSHFPAGDGED
jgi:hypothetical protein